MTLAARRLPGLATLAALTIAAVAAGPVGAAPSKPPQTIRPGWWEATDTVLSPFRSTNVEHRCVTPKDVGRFMGCRLNHHYVCNCADQSYADGRIRFHGVCLDKRGAQVTITGRGDYAPDRMTLNAEATFSLGGLPIQASARTQARRLGDRCPSPGSPN